MRFMGAVDAPCRDGEKTANRLPNVTAIRNFASIDFERLYRQVIPSVVSIYVGAGGYGADSGFVYDLEPDGTGYAVTNKHVVTSVLPGNGRRESTLGDVDVRFNDGTWRQGTVDDVDTYTDLALVTVPGLPESATPLTVASDASVSGRPVAALGNPMGLDGTMTVGVVSGVNRSMPTASDFAIPDVVQTDAPINPGNSGGPLVALVAEADPTDPVYEVVGVNRARGGDNIGFAISPLLVDRVVSSLRTAGRHRHPYLRVRTLDVSSTVAESLGTAPGGLLVVDASTATGLRAATTRVSGGGFEIPVAGDVIVAVDGRPVGAHEELMRYLLLERDPGESVVVTVDRGGARLEVETTLGERPPVSEDDGKRAAAVESRFASPHHDTVSLPAWLGPGQGIPIRWVV